MNGPCAKQIVTATIISESGERFVGTNDCRSPQDHCPRGNLPSGVGYGLCRDVCEQTGHAEINALAAAGDQAAGAHLYLEGHTYLCKQCWSACTDAGILCVTIAAPPAI